MLFYFYYVENHLPVDNQIFGGSNLGTVAIIPASEDVPISNFSFELSLALHTIGKSHSPPYIMHIHDGKMSLIQSRDSRNELDVFIRALSLLIRYFVSCQENFHFLAVETKVFLLQRTCKLKVVSH